VIELGGGLGLAQQAGATFSAQGQVRQNLDRYVTIEQGVASAVDNTCATPSEFGV
jgi:hypothetical protein